MSLVVCPSLLAHGGVCIWRCAISALGLPQKNTNLIFIFLVCNVAPEKSWTMASGVPNLGRVSERVDTASDMV